MCRITVWAVALGVLWQGAAAIAAPPQRIVSLNVCADQFVMALADPAQIAGLSTFATDPYLSLYADKAQRLIAAGVPQIDADLEQIVLLNPDLVVMSKWGNTHLKQAMQRLHIPVHELALPITMEAISAETIQAGQAMGQPQRAQGLVALLPQRPDPARHKTALYLMPGGRTVGAQSFVDMLLNYAGLENAAADGRRYGWSSITMEEMLMAPPDVVVTSFFRKNRYGLSQRYIHHPVITHIMENSQHIAVPGKYWVCGGWFVHHALDDLRRVQKTDF
jgi:iron complex transport system substrate-binding protein